MLDKLAGGSRAVKSRVDDKSQVLNLQISALECRVDCLLQTFHTGFTGRDEHRAFTRAKAELKALQKALATACRPEKAALRRDAGKLGASIDEQTANSAALAAINGYRQVKGRLQALEAHLKAMSPTASERDKNKAQKQVDAVFANLTLMARQESARVESRHAALMQPGAIRARQECPKLRHLVRYTEADVRIDPAVRMDRSLVLRHRLAVGERMERAFAEANSSRARGVLYVSRLDKSVFPQVPRALSERRTKAGSESAPTRACIAIDVIDSSESSGR